MDKVEEIYLAENNSEKVTEFLQILQSFNQSTDKVEELYYVSVELLIKVSITESVLSLSISENGATISA